MALLNADDLRRDCRWLGLTYEQLALASGVRVSTITKIFTGRRALTLPIAMRLHAAIEAVRRERQADTSLSFEKGEAELLGEVRQIPLSIDDVAAIVRDEMSDVTVELCESNLRAVCPGLPVCPSDQRQATAFGGDWYCRVTGETWAVVLTQLRQRHAAMIQQETSNVSERE